LTLIKQFLKNMWNVQILNNLYNVNAMFNSKSTYKCCFYTGNGPIYTISSLQYNASKCGANDSALLPEYNLQNQILYETKNSLYNLQNQILYETKNSLYNLQNQMLYETKNSL
jgi:hypothetical protein